MRKKYNKEMIPVAKMLRKNMTKEEKHLWYDFLHDHPVHFKRQKALGKYVADFYSAEARLVIELDGSQHFTDVGKSKDKERTKYLEEYGIHVLRFKNYQVREGFRSVCKQIDEAIEQAKEKD